MMIRERTDTVGATPPWSSAVRYQQLLFGFAAALGGGLLIGIERELVVAFVTGGIRYGFAVAGGLLVIIAAAWLPLFWIA